MIGFIKYVVRLADHTRTIIEHAEQEVQAMNPILTAREGIFQRAFCTYIIFSLHGFLSNYYRLHIGTHYQKPADVQILSSPLMISAAVGG